MKYATLTKKHPLSKNQFGFLRHVTTKTIDVDFLRSCKDVTLWSLLYRGYLRVLGETLFLTDLGNEAYDSYNLAEIPTRKVEADLTERSRILLASARLKAKKRAVA